MKELSSGGVFPVSSNQAITLKGAAEMLCCSYSTALRLAKDGELKAFRVRGAWRTSTRACEKFIKQAFDDQAGSIGSIEVDDANE